jgi:hypothetical protein
MFAVIGNYILYMPFVSRCLSFVELYVRVRPWWLIFQYTSMQQPGTYYYILYVGTQCLIYTCQVTLTDDRSGESLLSDR